MYYVTEEISGLLIVGNELWVATSVSAVEWDINKGTYRKYTISDGLANNNVHAIAQDNKGNLWFGTYGGGVSRYEDRPMAG